nr:putative retrotransposon Gag domain-containing protein [Tanacetum cinerariifolium]
MGTPAGRVILFSTIPTTIPDTTLVITPPTTQTDTTVIPTEIPIITPTIPPSPDYTPASLDYSHASDTKSNPSSDHIPPLPAISPFLSSTDDTTDSDTPDTPPSPTHDHSSPDLPSTYAGPSRKRHRSSMRYVPALPPVSGDLSPVRADLIPLPKRVRDFGYLADVEVDPKETSLRDDVMVRDALRDRGIDDRVTVEAVDREESETGTRGPIEVNEGVQREQGRRIIGIESTVTVLTERIAGLERDNKRLRDTTSVESQRVDRLQRGMSRMQIELRKMPNTRSRVSMTHEEVEELVARRVAEEMEARKAAMNLEPLNENGDEQEGNGGNGNGGNGENGNGNRNRNHGMNYEGFMPVARECTFQDFLKCKPNNFLGTEGIVGLSRWFEKIEIVFNISNFPPKYQVKYAACTLQDSALTWWNSYKRTIGVDAAHAMKWAGLIKLVTKVYYPRNEI